MKDQRVYITIEESYKSYPLRARGCTLLLVLSLRSPLVYGCSC